MRTTGIGVGDDDCLLYDQRLREQEPTQSHLKGGEAVRAIAAAVQPANPKEEKTYCVDFDGVLAFHNTGDPIDQIGQPLGPGIKLAKQIKAAGHRLVILTARPKNQHHTIEGWLKGHGVRADLVTNEKPPAEVYIDDRAARWPRNHGHEGGEHE